VRQIAILALPCFPWWDPTSNEDLVQLWTTATSAIPYTDEISQSVIDTLLQITSEDPLQLNIPIGMCLWLKMCPSLPPLCRGRSKGSTVDIVQTIQGLKEIETLKSYLLLI